MPTYPASPQVTVDALLNQPRLIARALTSLTAKRFVADRIFAHGTPDQVAAGSVIYQRAESIFPTQNAEEVGVRGEWPRTGWSEAVLTAIVHKYGLEVPISFESIRRNQLDQVARAQVKLANAVTKFVDTTAMALLTADAAVLTSGETDWTAAAAGVIIKAIAKAIQGIINTDNGYEPDTLVVHPDQNYDMLVDADIRGALPRESATPNPVLTGRPAPVLGLNNIFVTPQATSGTAFVLSSKIVGTIADEAPAAGEGYVSFTPGGSGPSIPGSTGPYGYDYQNGAAAGGFPPVYVKVYTIEGRDERIVRAARFPAMWIAEPTSAYKLTGV